MRNASSRSNVCRRRPCENRIDRTSMLKNYLVMCLHLLGRIYGDWLVLLTLTGTLEHMVGTLPLTLEFQISVVLVS